jgi:cytidylate kinase
MIIAVDGPSAAGKGTIARAIASRLGYHFLDTGALYRMVGHAMLGAARPEDDEISAADFARAVDPSSVAEQELRNERVAAMASRVAAMPKVRQALLDYQRSFARKPPGAVLDGRDIGTVVCPDADLKIFLTASTEVRARRRYQELQSTGYSVDYQSVLDDLKARDDRDAGRAAAPTRPAADAILIDTSDMTRDEVLDAVMALVDARKKR